MSKNSAPVSAIRCMVILLSVYLSFCPEVFLRAYGAAPDGVVIFKGAFLIFALINILKLAQDLFQSK